MNRIQKLQFVETIFRRLKMIIRRDLFDRIIGWVKGKAGFKEYWVTVQFTSEELTHRLRGILLKVSHWQLFQQHSHLISPEGAHPQFA